MTTSIEDATQSALARHLATQLGGSVKVSKQWPAPERKLPELAVTVIQAGDSTHTLVQAEDISHQAGSSAGKYLYRWLVLEVTQPLQVDCWATTPPARSDLRKRLTDALNKGRMADTYPIPGGLVLSLDPALDGWTGYVDYAFPDGISNLDVPDAAQQSEYRAIAHGWAHASLYIDAETPRLARIILKQTLDGATRPDTVVS